MNLTAGGFIYIVLLFSTSIVKAQALEKIRPVDLFVINQYPELDSSININNISLNDCNLLIEKMYKIDQQYRDSTIKYSSDKTKRDFFNKTISINDIVNQILLLKIIERYGWPCDDTKKISTKAWFIAWHARSNFVLLSKFYSYIDKANILHCIDPVQFYDIEEYILRARSVRNK